MSAAMTPAERAQDEKMTTDQAMTLLAARAGESRVKVDAALDEALEALDAELATLAAELEVEYLGPGIGMQDMGAEHVFRLAVRHHVWDVDTAGWGVKVCDGLPQGNLRPMWAMQGVGRLRKQQLVKVLPEFLRGYAAAVAAAGKAEAPAGQKLQALAERCA